MLIESALSNIKMTYRLNGGKGKQMNFIYVIYDNIYNVVLAQFITEEECIKVYKRHYNRKQCDWIGINLHYLLEDMQKGKHMPNFINYPF